ncbi:inhibin beta chain [Hyalella azteca]|uniref:Inhibin beta chain n=1 Tax=Hyalella azteca TaxID=294128 RepID=A0A8B7NH52_HYAAZ|nr:inhibin beta chain [Hyalella azteca]
MMASSSKTAAYLLLVAVVGVCADQTESDVRTATEAPCPQCFHRSQPPVSLMPADMHALRLTAIKTQLLNKLRLQHRPNVSLDVPRQVLLETLQRSGDQPVTNQLSSENLQDEDDVLPVTSEIITFASPGALFNNHTLLEFTQSEVDMDALEVTEAILWVFVRSLHGRHGAHHHGRHLERHHQHPSVNGARTYLWVFRVPPDPPSAVRNPNHMVGSQLISLSEPGWQRINITSAASHWFAQPGEPLRLLVDCSSCSGHIEAVLFNNYKFKGANKPDSRGLDAAYRPVLVIKTKPSPTRRLARRALQCERNTEHCCKEEFYVSFSELNWDDWILAPKGYHANFCRGSCDSMYQTADSLHTAYAHVMEEARRVREPGAISQCCAPTRFSPMTLIYIDENKSIIKRDVPRMVVEECGCA